MQKTQTLSHVETLSTLVIALEDTASTYLNELIASISPKEKMSYTIIDLGLIDHIETPTWFRNLRVLLKQHNLILVGIRNPKLSLEICKALRIPIIDEQPSAQAPSKPLTYTNLYLHKPIRSGQQVFAKQGSLIVTAQVSASAEIAAYHDVHVLNNCYGKVIAGTSGNLDAVIVLFSGYPEMISIAGNVLNNKALGKIEKPTLFQIKDGQVTATIL